MAISNDCLSHPFMNASNMLQRQKLIFHNEHENNSFTHKKAAHTHT